MKDNSWLDWFVSLIGQEKEVVQMFFSRQRFGSAVFYLPVIELLIPRLNQLVLDAVYQRHRQLSSSKVLENFYQELRNRTTDELINSIIWSHSYSV